MDPNFKAPLAGFLSWVVPGLGQYWLGERRRGQILMFVITLTFWSGVAIGGVRGTVNPDKRLGWFLAEMGTGGNAIAAYVLGQAVHWMRSQDEVLIAKERGGLYLGDWRSIDIGVVYASVAGLLNLLIILDAIGRAQRMQHVAELTPTRSAGGP